MTRAKRATDVIASVAGIVLLSPLLLAIALIVRLEDGGTALFRQTRVGKGGKPFGMFKFRTMVPDGEALGRPLTIGNDPRITRVGHFLRRSKLDELPQLVNVVRGEMSLVGPRPEVPRYVAHYSEEQARVLDLTPGITDPASVRFRNESSILSSVEDPERHYIETVMPEKIRINLGYAASANVWTDVRVIVRTILGSDRT